MSIKILNLKLLKTYNIFKEELLSLEVLKTQGFNNISYLLKTSKKSYIIRVFKSNESVNISREFEFKTQKKAHKKDIAPKAIFLNSEFMIYEYTKGIHKSELKSSDIKTLAKQIKKLHKIKTKAKTYDLKSDLLNYKKILKDKESKELISQSLKSLKKLKKFKKELVLTHHDLNPKNIIFRKNKIKIIDWEYSGINDRFFDLAAVCIEFKLNKKEEKLFLENYLEEININHYSKLKHFKIIYKNLCDLWFEKLNHL
ncbi:choline/ethanolamine kinase family protein [Arcobacter sp. s6]|uniref:choline/ethanolamine kinase family protein n=1 Tax=Arcobacter sp. s6 TaxID=3230363 RepID=UPI0034A04A3D